MPKTRPKTFAIVPAAGSGKRLGGSVKKQFLVLRDKPIIVHTLQRFEHCTDIDEIAVAVPEQSIAEMESLISRYRLHKVSMVTVGGEKRQDSVFNALRRFTFKPTDIVLVHDGVRPFIESKRIGQLVRTCREHEAAVLAVQPKDTIRRSRGGEFFDQTLDRNALWLVQTPQAFRAEVLMKAFKQAKQDRFYGTDESGLVERIGVKVKIVEGSYDNIKITTQEDIDLGGLILERWKAKGLM
ncbi:MAG: 2-C-methyl-D-erythritol 4-phosphate cytidylyltransferase [Ignavibacteriales bacterium]|nr:2-C-methyl-D-erythritol 4-phosphate cytidylyltransferase [Ignavibacteriales bacterium]